MLKRFWHKMFPFRSRGAMLRYVWYLGRSSEALMAMGQMATRYLKNPTCKRKNRPKPVVLVGVGVFFLTPVTKCMACVSFDANCLKDHLPARPSVFLLKVCKHETKGPQKKWIPWLVPQVMI